MMGDFSWIPKMLTANDVDPPTEFLRLLSRKKMERGSFIFLDSADGENATNMINKILPYGKIIAFARRLDYDGVICFSLGGSSFAKGEVLELDDDRPFDYPLDVIFPSLSDWAKAREEDIAERIKNGWNEPYDP